MHTHTQALNEPRSNPNIYFVNGDLAKFAFMPELILISQ